MLMFRGLHFKSVFNRAKPFDTKVKKLQETPVEILFILIHIQILFFPSLFALLLSNKKKMFLLHFQAVLLYSNQLNE